MTEQEEEDYLHHINVVGYLNGVAEELIPKNLREAYNLGTGHCPAAVCSIRSGRRVNPFAVKCDSCVASSSQLSPTARATSARKPNCLGPETIRNLAAGEMRFFLGDQYADWLGIPNVPVEKRLAGLLNRLPIFPQLLTLSRIPYSGIITVFGLWLGWLATPYL